MGSDSSSRRRRPLRDLDGGGGGDIEEGEYVPEAPESDDSGAGGDEELCRLQRRLEALSRRVSWLEVVMASGRVAVPPRPARPAPQPAREYSCKLCGKSYSSHQGLGGHAAGHKNRQKEAEAAAAAAMMGQEDGGAFLAAFRRGRRAAQPPRACRKCHKVFPTGVALGGHMRMHYTGPPIVHRKNEKQRGLVSEADLRLALSTATEAPPQPAAAVAGRVRLFGIDIGSQVQAPPPPEDQGSGTAEGSSSAGEQE